MKGHSVSFVRRKFNSMLGVSTVAMAVNFIVMLAGSLVAGNLLGAEGLAGVNVCAPVFALASFVGSLVSIGSGLVFSRAMGEFDERRAAGVWSQGVLLAIVVGAVIYLVMLFGGEAFFDINGITGAIRSEAMAYWRWQAVSMGLTPLLLLVMAMVYADGDGAVAIAAGGCYVVGTVGFSCLFTALSGNAGGISGGIALAIALVIAVSSLHFLRADNHLKFIRYFSLGDFGRSLAGSAPDATIYLCWGLLVLVVNRFTVSAFGAELLAVVALGVSVVEFSIVFDGVGEALIPLGGMYSGEGNSPALRELAGHSAAVATAEGVVVGAVMLAFAEPIASLYGFRGEAAALLPQAISVMRALAFAMPFMGLLMMVNTHYLIVGHPWLAVAVTVLKDFAMPCLCSLVCGAAFGFAGIWLGFIAGYALAAAGSFAFVRLRYGRDRFPWLIVSDGSSVDFSVCLCRQSLADASGRIGRFLSERGVADGTVARVVRTVKEHGEVAMAANGAKCPCVEYFLSLSTHGSVRLIVRDDGVKTAVPSSGASEFRYLNTLNCNRTEHRFGIGQDD